MNARNSLAAAVAAAITAIFLSVAIQPAKATVITLTGGDAGEGLTLDPALVVAAENVRGAVATLQGVSVPTNAANIAFVNASIPYSPVFPTPASPTPNDTAITTLLNNAAAAFNQPIVIDFTGLSPNTLHTINLLIADNNDERNLAFSFNGGPIVDAFRTVSGAGYNVENVIQSSAGGSISVAITSDGYYNFTFGSGEFVPTSYPIVSSAIVSVVPEPSTIAMLIGVGASIAACRLRRSRRREPRENH